ncbi:MAG: hypothetical protein CV089_21605 [Nitrospira sp. WS110]|nr:hypothetical protein [Nitrospira sp. WS110]
MRRLRTIKFAIGFTIAVLAMPGQADMISPSHFCSRPFKPFEFTSPSERELFLLEVEIYKQCITDFVEEQERAVRAHRQAAEEAIEEWNSFVNLELR